MGVISHYVNDFLYSIHKWVQFVLAGFFLVFVNVDGVSSQLWIVRADVGSGVIFTQASDIAVIALQLITCGTSTLTMSNSVLWFWLQQ